MRCQACGADNRTGRKFCSECGAALTLACPSCGAANEPGERFCGECGAQLDAAGVPAQEPSSAERRLVSVLFADLVGFTALSEHRDAEEVRELLSRYFETARQVIARFGGTVEKFIGDAVMAVWGAPVAREDDAERAVRAALDLVAAVSALGDELGAEGLRLRAAVLTGEAAVTVGAQGEGLVAGDLVNSASRAQSVAPPGFVLVGERTRRATEAAIAYEDAGTHELKGKSETLPLWRALRVVATRRGEGRAMGLEAPFVGREGELRLVKELFHSTADEGKARLVSVVGVGGIGKSRLSWEFQKYLDGLVDDIRWHRGRCLAYGEGVAFWALAEMVRMRAGIVEEEPPDSARAKLRKATEQHVPDAEERAWLEPRLAHLLGLAEGAASSREDLFSAWRLFFERLAQEAPTVLVFEDLHWADTALLDFVEYLLHWSRAYPLFVLTLSRPELADRHPTWGAGKRDFTSLFLEPISAEAMDALLGGLVPGLPDELRARIRERAEGIPLYAVETVRMLLDRGLLESDGGRYRVTAPVDALEVPETLHALIAARLDDLAPDERRLLGDAAVLGKSFTKRAISALSGLEGELDPLLAALLRKEILTLQADPRSPERGQYTFLQALVQKVAHDTLSRRERKARHLAAAEFYETGWGADEEEIVEVIASHYLDAFECDPAADDAEVIKAKARERLTRAGERATSLAANAEAQRYFDQAADLADDAVEQAELLDRAGEAAQRAGRMEDAVARGQQAISLFEANGRTHAAARASAHLGAALFHHGQIDAAIEHMERSFAVLVGDEPDEDLAALAAELARLHYFAGDFERAIERVEFALEVAESLWLPERLAEALNTKNLVLTDRGRTEEALALLRHALKLALENDKPAAAGRSYINLAHKMFTLDRYEEARALDLEGLALVRKLGNRIGEAYLLQHLCGDHFIAGEWDEALALADELTAGEVRAGRATALFPNALIHVDRGDPEAGRAGVDSWAEQPADLQERAQYDLARAVVLRAEGRPAEAIEAGEAVFAFAQGMHTFAKYGFVVAVEAALDLEQTDRAEALLAHVRARPPGLTPPFLRAQSARFEATLAARRGEHAVVEPSFEAATRAFRDLGIPFSVAVTLLEHSEWLIERGRAAEAEERLAEARSIFERLKARPWLERVERAEAPHAAALAREPV